VAPSENPYESPRVPEAVEPHGAERSVRHGWKFVLLGIAIAAGLVSFAPWLAVVLGLLSGPVFLRYFAFGWKRPDANRWERATSRAAGAAGAIGFGLSVLAAASGAFFGTCTISSYGAALTGLGDVMQGVWGGEDYAFIRYAIGVGVGVGLLVGIVSLAWLIRFYYTWPRHASDREVAELD